MTPHRPRADPAHSSSLRQEVSLEPKRGLKFEVFVLCVLPGVANIVGATPGRLHSLGRWLQRGEWALVEPLSALLLRPTPRRMSTRGRKVPLGATATPVFPNPQGMA